MPEIPDLENIRTILTRTISGKTIESIELLKPQIVRMVAQEFEARVAGTSIESIDRYGKFLLFYLNSGDQIVLNMMLVGRLQHVHPSAKRGKSVCWVLGLSDGRELRYLDQRYMGMTYLAVIGDL